MMISLNDLSASVALDYKAMAELKGGNCESWQQVSSFLVTGAWGPYQQFYNAYVGITWHDGYLTRQTFEGWKRSRTQTEYSYWNHWVCI